MTPRVEAAELGIPGAGQRRQFGPFGDLRAPAVDRRRNAARLEGIYADLVQVAELARFELWRERRRQINIALLLDDEFSGVGRPALELGSLGAQPSALSEVFVGPDMDDPIEGPDFGVPEG